MIAALAGLTRRHRGRTGGEVLDARGAQRLYDAIAPLYDIPAALYQRGVGCRLGHVAIAELRLRPGDTVVDLGTGTGCNLPRLAEAVGPSGRVIGVDISARMLARASTRVRRVGAQQVDLVAADFTHHELPAGTRAVLATFAMEMPPDYDEVLRRLVLALPPGGRIAVNGLRDPEGWPRWLVNVGSALNRPFGVTSAYRSHRPWMSLARYTDVVVYREALAGAIYLAAGSAPDTADWRTRGARLRAGHGLLRDHARRRTCNSRAARPA